MPHAPDISMHSLQSPMKHMELPLFDDLHSLQPPMNNRTRNSLQSTMNYTTVSPNALHNSPQVTTNSHTSYEHNQHMYVPWTPLFDGNVSEIPFAQSDSDTHELDMPDFDDNLSELRTFIQTAFTIQTASRCHRFVAQRQ
eukprot:24853_1